MASVVVKAVKSDSKELRNYAELSHIEGFHVIPLLGTYPCPDGVYTLIVMPEVLTLGSHHDFDNEQLMAHLVSLANVRCLSGSTFRVGGVVAAVCVYFVSVSMCRLYQRGTGHAGFMAT